MLNGGCFSTNPRKVVDKKLISRWDRRKLPLKPRCCCTSNLPTSSLRRQRLCSSAYGALQICLWYDVMWCARKPLAYRTRENLGCRYSAIYSTLTNTALDLWS